MRTLFALISISALSVAARATETAAFLKIGTGARALAMGGAYTAIADDGSSIGWNPAGLAALSKRELGVTHEELPESTHFDFASYAHPTKYGVLGVAGTYLSQGTIQGRDANGAPIGGYSASDQAATLGFASSLGPDLKLGANVKYVRSSIADASAQTGAIDVGGQYAFERLGGPGLPVIGAAVQNFGPGMKFLDETAHLPLTMALGVGYRLPSRLTVSFDYKGRPYSHDSEFGAGAEYALLTGFALRVGYTTAKAYTDIGGAVAAFNGFSTGFGVKFRSYSLDYSFTPDGELGYVQAVSLGARF